MTDAASASPFARTLERAWTLHGDNPRAACSKLESALPAMADDADVEGAARFLFHVYGVHFGDWSGGAKALRGLRASTVWLKHSRGERTIKRSLRALELAWVEDDGEVSLRRLTMPERVSAYCLAAQCLMERGEDSRAMNYLQKAATLSEEMSPSDRDASVAYRDLAVAGNNIAAGYEDWPMLDENQRDQMTVAAHIGRIYWERAGTWLEVERAEYRLAKCLLLAGYPALAVKHAQTCLAICEDNNAPALEYFFGVEALAYALAASENSSLIPRLQAKAQTLFDQLSKDDQVWCLATLARVQSLSPVETRSYGTF